MSKDKKNMFMNDQAVGAVMMALQKSLMEQTDIVPVLKNFDFVLTGSDQSELIVTNPPTFKVGDTTDSTDEQDA